VPAPTIGAASGILVTGDGSILWSKDAKARRAVASTTKILTALVVIEENSPGEMVTASARAEAVGANDPLITELELTAGERLSVEQLLYGLLLPSGSDAAIALAEHTSGSVDRFAELMNQRARSLGAVDSNFTNPEGLDDPAAYSTAYDLTLITRTAMDSALFRKIVGTPTYEIPWPGRPAPRKLVNRNELLGKMPGVTGVKTGNTRIAGKSLVASATRDGEERIAVILGSPDPFAESQRVLEFGFSAFKRISIVEADRPWGQLTYGDGTTFSLVSPREVKVLIGASSPAPTARYRPDGSVLVVDVPGGLTIPLAVRCGEGEGPCRAPKRRGSALAGLISLFAPVLSALK
jgi:D-alanyl-D-alanine carboxypeptidase (penicillin-binding protein 5/6)